MTEVLDTGSAHGPERSPMVALSSSKMLLVGLAVAAPASVLLLLLLRMLLVVGRAAIEAAVCVGWMDGWMVVVRSCVCVRDPIGLNGWIKSVSSVLNNA